MKLQLYPISMFGRRAETCSVACCVINQTALNYVSWMSWQRPDAAWSVFSILAGTFIATNNGKLTRSGRTDSGGLTRVGDYVDGPDRSRSRGVWKLLMRLTHLVVLRRVYFRIKTDCAASRNERFSLVIRGLCEKWYSSFEEETSRSAYRR